MADTTLKRHPVRAAAWGFILGLGVFIYLTFVWPIIALDSWTTVVTKAAIVVLIVMAISVLWGMFGPAKKPRGYANAAAPGSEAPPPAPMDPSPPPAPEMMPEAPPAPVMVPDEAPPAAPEGAGPVPEPVEAAIADEAPAVAPSLCPSCGTETRQGAKVCHACGMSLAEPSAGEPSDA